jgi:hypothetical protein
MYNAPSGHWVAHMANRDFVDLRGVFVAFTAVAALFVMSALDLAAAQSMPCANPMKCSHRAEHRQEIRLRSARARVQLDANGNSGSIIGGRPGGCPHNYCGCGLRMYLGISDKRFNLAWNWAKFFPRTSARAGAAAVRRGHVMLLESQVSGSVWIVRDYNSGSGLSRIHERDVRGYIFVDPRAGKMVARS